MNLTELEKSLQILRDEWSTEWLGLPAIVDDALRQLGFKDDAELSTADASLHRCIMQMSEVIEMEGSELSRKCEELSYHNRLHIADVVKALTCLLQAAREELRLQPGAPLSHEEWIAYLSVVAHDYMHTGFTNTFPSQIELLTSEALRPWMAQAGVTEEDQRLIIQIIIKTDPNCVAETHAAAKDKPFDLKNPLWLTVLVQESDIFASSLPTVGIDLTQRLSSEWSSFSVERAQSLLTNSSRLYFLKNQAIFSSPASKILGIQKLVDQEVESLLRAEDRTT